VSTVLPAGLPADFDALYEAAVRDGLLDEPAGALRQRAVAAIDASGAAAGVESRRRSPGPWAARMLAEFEQAVRAEICAGDGTGLNAAYRDLLDDLLTKNGIAELAALVLKLVRAISPSLAVSTVGLYIAVWLLKIGLNRWCAVGTA